MARRPSSTSPSYGRRSGLGKGIGLPGGGRRNKNTGGCSKGGPGHSKGGGKGLGTGRRSK